MQQQAGQQWLCDSEMISVKLKREGRVYGSAVVAGIRRFESFGGALASQRARISAWKWVTQAT